MSCIYQLETSQDGYQLEDGSGVLLIEPRQILLARSIRQTVNLAVTIGVSRMAIITVVRGDCVDLVYTISDANGVVDLTGGTIDWKALRSGSDTAILTKTGTLTDASNGVTTVSLQPVDTVAMGGTYALLATYTDDADPANVYTFDDGAFYVQVDPE